MKRVLPLTVMAGSLLAFDQGSMKHFDAIKIGHTTIGIDGSTIHDMLWVIDTINGIQLGVPQHDAQHTIKKYLFNDTYYTLQELVILEAGGTLTHSQRLELQKTMLLIKDDVKDTVLHCMQQLVVKAVAHSFVDQWAEQAERQQSLLKTWVATDRATFEQLFDALDSTVELNLFLTDVKNFFSQVIISCPRAWQEFVDHNQEYKEHTTRKKDVSTTRI